MLILLISLAFAADTPNFHCQVMPKSFELNGKKMVIEAHPTQVLEYSSMCPSEKKDPNNVICLYEALCRSVSEEEAKEPPPDFTPEEALVELTRGRLHRSSLVCRGRATLANGEITKAHCEEPADCKKREILYNYMTEAMTPKDLFQLPHDTTQNVNVPNAAWETQ